LKRLLLLLASSLLFTSNCFGAIVFDSEAGGNIQGASSKTQAITVAVQDNRLLVVAYGGEDATAANLVVTGVTYNGASLTKIHDINHASSTYNRGELWYMLAPDTGTHNVVVSMTGTVTGGGIRCSSFYGVAQQAPEATQEATGTTTIATNTITTITDNAWIIGGGTHAGTGIVPVAVDGETMSGYGWYYATYWGGYEPVASAAETVFSFTVYPTSQDWCLMSASFAPYVAAAGVIKTLNGLAWASVKTRNGVAVGSIKTISGVASQ